MDIEIRKAPFMDTELMAARDNEGNIYAGVSYICNGIGLSKNEKDRQVKNVQRDRVLMKGCGKFAAGVFDPNNETVALKLEYLPLWLAKINITPTMGRETPELADRLEQYQLKAKDVLAAAFLPQFVQTSGPRQMDLYDRATQDKITYDTFTFEMTLSRLRNGVAISGVNGDMMKLWNYQRAGEAVPLVIGNWIIGKYRWTIVKHKIVWEAHDGNGLPYWAVISVELQKYLKG